MARTRKAPAVLHLAVLLLLVQAHAFVSNPRDFGGRNFKKLEYGSSRSPTYDISSTATTTTHEVILNNALLELNIRPPWKTPELSTRTFNYVLSQIAESQRDDAGTLAEAMLRYMLENKEEHKKLQPDYITLNTVLASFAKSCSKNRTSKKQVAEAALRIFKEWQDLYSQGRVAFDVDRVSYNTVMSAFAKSGQPQRTEEMLKLLKQRFNETGNEKYRPDAVSHGTLLHAFAVAAKADEASRLFFKLKEHGPEPSLLSYNDVLYAYANAKLPRDAERFMQQWMEDKGARVQPVARSFNIVLHALAQMPDRFSVDRAEKLLRSMPVRDSISYTTLIAANCRLGRILSVEAVDGLVDGAYDEGLVNSAFVSNVLYSLATVDRGEVRVYAEKLVLEMKERGVTLDLAVYNALIYCWAKAGDREAGKRVVEILSFLEQDEGYTPNVRTYTSVIDALKGRGPEAVSAAEAIVSRMEQLGPAPNAHTYTALIQVHARSRLPYKATKASEVLNRMKASATSEPNVVSYNAVLNACEYTNPSDRKITEDALRVACLAFDEIREAPFRPNHVTYGSFLGVLRNLVPSNARQQIVALVFRRCCQEGQVSRLVLKRLKEATESSETFKTLLQGKKDDRLPREWTCNVRESKARNHI